MSCDNNVIKNILLLILFCNFDSRSYELIDKIFFINEMMTRKSHPSLPTVQFEYCFELRSYRRNELSYSQIYYYFIMNIGAFPETSRWLRVGISDKVCFIGKNNWICTEILVIYK
jgi:hypothetical protein